MTLYIIILLNVSHYKNILNDDFRNDDGSI